MLRTLHTWPSFDIHSSQADSTSQAKFSQVKMIKMESEWPEHSLRTAFIQRNLQTQNHARRGRDANTRTHRPRMFQDQPDKSQGTCSPTCSELDPKSLFEKFLLRVLCAWVPVLALYPSCSSWGRDGGDPRPLHGGSQLPDSRRLIQARQSF